MTKKLFVVGAGASKDFDNEMLLGADIIEKIKQLKFQIYFELIALVAVKITISEIGGMDSYASALDNVIKKFLQKKHNFFRTEQFKEEKGNRQIIEEFIQDLEKVLDLRGFLGKMQKEEVIKQSVDFLLDKNTNFFNNLVQFRPSSIMNKKRGGNEFNKAIDGILDFIFTPIESEVDKEWEDVRNDLLNELKTYVTRGIILSCMLDRFNSEIYSIDHMINFLTSVTHYNDEFATSHNLPSTEEIKEFAREHTANLIAKNTKGVPKNKNWIEYLEKEIFLDRDRMLESKVSEVFLINFNYDPLIEWHFNFKSSPSNSKPRENSLNKFTKKASDSHVYGAITSLGGSHGLVENIIDQMSWVISNNKVQKKQIIFSNRNNPLEKTIEETSKDKMKKIKEDLIEKKGKRNINFIRTDLNSEEIEEHFNKIKNSKKIYFLGFGFDNWNLKNIGIYDENFNLTKKAKTIKNKYVYVTNYGDLPKIRIVLEKIFNVRLYKDSEVNEWDENKQKEVSYSFWRSKDINSSGNKVFISTKPVYKALNEDFD